MRGNSPGCARRGLDWIRKKFSMESGIQELKEATQRSVGVPIPGCIQNTCGYRERFSCEHDDDGWT